MMLTTERLIIRQWKDTDAKELYTLAKDPQVGPRAGWPPHRSIQESLTIIREILSPADALAIEAKNKGLIGSIGLKQGDQTTLNLPFGQAEVGYWIGQAYWGQGYAPEALSAIMEWAFSTLELQSLWCGYYDGNIQSKIVQEKCGFQYQFSKEEVYVGLLNEYRTEHFTSIDHLRYEKRKKN